MNSIAEAAGRGNRAYRDERGVHDDLGNWGGGHRGDEGLYRRDRGSDRDSDYPGREARGRDHEPRDDRLGRRDRDAGRGRELRDKRDFDDHPAQRQPERKLNDHPAPPSSLSLLRLADVMKRTTLGRSALYEAVKDGTFPRPVKAGRTSAWVDAEIEQWIRDRMDAR